MTRRRTLPRKALRSMALVAAAALVAVGVGGPASAHKEPPTPKPTIVLVHGAFADSSGWTEVIERLTRKGYVAQAFSNPLRGPIEDGENLRAYLSTIEGPVVLVAHSYGGAVITNGATGNPNVKALVYVAAYALAEGEGLLQANELGGGHTDVGDHLVYRPVPGQPATNPDGYIDPLFFHQLFAQDLPKREAAVMAATQRPAAAFALGIPSGPPAWAEIPSYYLVANQDRIIPPEAERAMAERAGAVTRSVDSSHVPMMSHPDVVTDLILEAARS